MNRTSANSAPVAPRPGGCRTERLLGRRAPRPPIRNGNGSRHRRQLHRPGAGTADVQAFKINLWQNIKTPNRCGNCHKAGGQSPMFARCDDVNLAYNDALDAS